MGNAAPLFLFQSHNQISRSSIVNHFGNFGANGKLYKHFLGPSWEKQISSLLANALLYVWIVSWSCPASTLLRLLHKTTYALLAHPRLKHITCAIPSDMSDPMQLLRDNSQSKWDHDWTWRLLWGAAIILHFLPHTTSHCRQTSIDTGSHPGGNHFSANSLLQCALKWLLGVDLQLTGLPIWISNVREARSTNIPDSDSHYPKLAFCNKRVTTKKSGTNPTLQ